MSDNTIKKTLKNYIDLLESRIKELNKCFDEEVIWELESVVFSLKEILNDESET